MEIAFPPSRIPLAHAQLIRRNMKDVYAAFDCIDSDRERLREFLPWVDSNKSAEDQVWYVGECAKDWDAGKLFDFGIHTVDEEFAGAIGIHNIAWDHHRCELGYWLHQKYEGQGLISSSVQALEKILFDLGFNRIEIRCDPRNTKSAGVPTRNGYRFEGILHQDVMFSGQFRDSAVYAKLSSDLKR